MESQTTTKTIRQEEAYTQIPQARRRELGTMVEDYQKAEPKISIEEMCIKMHPHCESISEALFIGAFVDFMLADNREERIKRVKDKLAKMLVGEIFGDTLKKAAMSMEEAEKAKEETKEEAQETK
jgi:hypothetical protein